MRRPLLRGVGFVLIVGGLAGAAARADDEVGLDALRRGDCGAAGAAINDGIGRQDGQSYFLAGYLYAWTGCVTEDLPRAHRYWERAVELGSGDARLALGLMHGMGYGVPQDYRAAYRWFTSGQAGTAERPALDAAAQTAYGYAHTLTQVAGRRVVYPRSFGGRPEGTILVTVHTATGAVDYGPVTDAASNAGRLVGSGPFRAAIDRAYREAHELVPKPDDLERYYVFETPWTFVLR